MASCCFLAGGERDRRLGRSELQPPDADLVNLSQQGDLAAFNVIVERYQSQVYNVSARVLGSLTSAEDATQETFIAAYKAIRGFRGGNLRAWLLRIATNVSRDHIRASRRRPHESLDEAMENPSFSLPSPEESPEESAIRGELAVEIQRAIVSLPEDQRVAIVLIDVRGFSYEETAEATGVSIGTVKSRLSRARARVRERLSQSKELLPDRFRH